MKRYFVEAPPHAPGIAKGIKAKGSPAESDSVRESAALPNIVVAELESGTANALVAEGAKLYEDVQFKIFDPMLPSDPAAHYWRTKTQPMFAPSGGTTEPNLSTVMAKINAAKAWETTKGAGATIAVIDTGIDGSLKEFRAERRSGVDPQGMHKGAHWQDTYGHGSMCAAIAAGSKADGGRYDGVAPEATVLAARSDLSATDIFFIYDDLIEARKNKTIKGPLVISNSYGLYQCSSDQVLEQDHPYLRNVLTAIDEGIVVVFAAGNNHWNVACNFDPAADKPNTIWSVNSHDRVLSVGTVDQNGSNQTAPNPHVNSSRGPGEWASVHKKPDVVAPTYGDIVWGGGYRVMDWWGTSGACPQVAGLAALILAANDALAPAEVADIIRQTAKPLSAPATCVGRGIIDCGAALARATGGA